jgi:hypothetical protein
MKIAAPMAHVLPDIQYAGFDPIMAETMFDSLTCRMCGTLAIKPIVCDSCGIVVCSNHKNERCAACNKGTWSIEFKTLAEPMELLLKMFATSNFRSSGPTSPTPVDMSASTAVSIAEVAKYCQSAYGDGLMDFYAKLAIPVEWESQIMTQLAAWGIKCSMDVLNGRLHVECSDTALRPLQNIKPVKPSDHGFPDVRYIPKAKL